MPQYSPCPLLPIYITAPAHLQATTEGTIMRVVEGPNVLAPPLKAHATCIASFPLVWTAVYTLGEDNFFHLGFF